MPTKEKSVKLKAVQGKAFFDTGGATVKNKAGKPQRRVCLIVKTRTSRRLLVRAARILVRAGSAKGLIVRQKKQGQKMAGKTWLQFRGKRIMLASKKRPGKGRRPENMKRKGGGKRAKGKKPNFPQK